MSVHLDVAWLATVVLVWVRFTVTLALSPLSQAVKAPPALWIALTLSMSLLLVASMRLPAQPDPAFGPFILSMLSEVLLGALLGLSVHAAFATLGMAGRLLDLQIGFGLANILDPVTRSSLPLMGVALTMTGVTIFFATDGHHGLLRGMAYSLAAIAPGAAWQFPDASALAHAIGAVYAFSIIVVAPMLLLLLLLELILDVASRLLPQMNIIFVGAPVKILAGLCITAMAAPGLGLVMRRLQDVMLGPWQGWLP